MHAGRLVALGTVAELKEVFAGRAAAGGRLSPHPGGAGAPGARGLGARGLGLRHAPARGGGGRRGGAAPRAREPWRSAGFVSGHRGADRARPWRTSSSTASRPRTPPRSRGGVVSPRKVGGDRDQGAAPGLARPAEPGHAPRPARRDARCCTATRSTSTCATSPLAVQDLDKSSASRDLVAAFVNSTYFDLVADAPGGSRPRPPHRDAGGPGRARRSPRPSPASSPRAAPLAVQFLVDGADANTATTRPRLRRRDRGRRQRRRWSRKPPPRSAWKLRASTTSRGSSTTPSSAPRSSSCPASSASSSCSPRCSPPRSPWCARRSAGRWSSSA